MADNMHSFGPTTEQDRQRTVGGVIGAVKEKAKDVTETAGQMADQAKNKAQEWASSATEKVGEAADTVSQYWQEHDLGDMADDVANLARRYPIATIFVGIGIGFLLAKATNMRS